MRMGKGTNQRMKEQQGGIHLQRFNQRDLLAIDRVERTPLLRASVVELLGEIAVSHGRREASKSKLK
eukprot:1513264-Pleurochrysis_carterae.AAC.2